MIKYQNLVTNSRAAKLKVSTPLITKFETCYIREAPTFRYPIFLRLTINFLFYLPFGVQLEIL